MYFVDRSVAVIKPKQPFLDWLNNMPDNDIDLSLDNLRADCTVLLIPEYDEPEEGVPISMRFLTECSRWSCRAGMKTTPFGRPIVP